MRRRVECRVDGSIFVIHGWQAHKLAREAGLRPTYNGILGGWVADTKRLPDLVAYLGYRNVDVEIVDGGGVDAPEVRVLDTALLEDGLAGIPVGLDDSTKVRHKDFGQPDLFGGAW